MIVLTTAGLLNALEAERIAPDHGVDLVLATGAIYSGFLIGLYLYGRAAVNRRASDMLDTWAPLPPTGDTATLETGLEWRAKLTKHLGLEASLRDSVATTTLVALPLLSALMTSLVGQGVNI